MTCCEEASSYCRTFRLVFLLVLAGFQKLKSIAVSSIMYVGSRSHFNSEACLCIVQSVATLCRMKILSYSCDITRELMIMSLRAVK